MKGLGRGIPGRYHGMYMGNGRGEEGGEGESCTMYLGKGRGEEGGEGEPCTDIMACMQRREGGGKILGRNSDIYVRVSYP